MLRVEQATSRGSFTLGKETTGEHCIPGKTVRLKHVEAIFEYDRKNDLKIANKLSDIHFSGRHFAKMKVNIAVQLFREAPPAIRYLIKLKMLHPEAKATAWFFDSSLSDTPKTSSINIDDSSHLAYLVDPSLKKLEEDPIQQAEELETLFVIRLTEADCDIVAYISGFLLRSILKSIDNWKNCKAVLTDSASWKYSSLIQLKEYVKNAGNLIQPSTSVMPILADFEENMKTFAEIDEVMKLKKPFSSILSALQKSVKIHLGCCSLHKPYCREAASPKYQPEKGIQIKNTGVPPFTLWLSLETLLSIVSVAHDVFLFSTDVM
ncbi:hypothetical protein HPB48_000531 [Haemaphysalis longicornis]|uniref:Uncharacterized protein n=1 Tax=Haemaphysalis longicornis TaxID=44386 RepID=A0A9J6FP12_HAELO|nr:hypothetical protein HPB48_000531 [Haemaphysalis longicornis]